MPTVLIQSLILAAGGMLSVGSITIVILLLLSDRGWHNGLAYALDVFFLFMVLAPLAVVVEAAVDLRPATGAQICWVLNSCWWLRVLVLSYMVSGNKRRLAISITCMRQGK